MELYDSKEYKAKTVTLVFRREQLLYDISNYAFVEGDIMGEDAEHARHQVKDIAEEGNVDRVNRVLNLAHDECVEQLYPYTNEEVEDGERLDDTLVAPEEYTIVLKLPEGFAKSTLKLERTLIHEYMVCRVLQDWLSITFANSAQNWERKMIQLKSKMKTALLSRKLTIRRKLKPF